MKKIYILIFILTFSTLKTYSYKGWENINLKRSLDFFFTSIYFDNEKEGWLTESSGAILRSIDGGESFFVIDSVARSLRCIRFIDYKEGWAVGATRTVPLRGLVLHTVNAGYDWEDISPPDCENIYFYKVQFLNRNLGWVAGDSGRIYKTTDGGNNWKRQNSKINLWIYNFQFTDSLNGNAIGQNGFVIRTTDGGENWKLLDPGINRNFYGLFFLSLNVGIFAGESNIMFGTVFAPGTPGDALIYESTQDKFWSVYLINKNRGYASGTNQIWVGTHDKSNYIPDKWVKQKVTGYDFMLDMCFINEDIGWVTGEYGNIMKTTTGGYTGVDFSPEQEHNDIMIYPNPVNSNASLNLKFSLATPTVASIYVSSVLGEQIEPPRTYYLDSGSPAITFSLSGELSSGTYYLNARLNNGETYTRAFVVVE
ncbi:MAG: Por secretion system C-terminal sorting protein [Ignavibacteria bacterium]|nr:Por secretion system C-terminal sorting protein [Ignavibacteria bacterium]